MATNSIIIKFPGDRQIRFSLYLDAAPVTCEAFCKALPFQLKLLHAKVSGQELWSPNGPSLDIIQENATVFLDAGEIAIGPLKPARNKLPRSIGIFYGDGKLVDCANVFAKVYEEDMVALKNIGEQVWLESAPVVTFEVYV